MASSSAQHVHHLSISSCIFSVGRTLLRAFIFAYQLYFADPITYPIAKLLDHVLGGKHQITYKKAELKSFLQLQKASAAESLQEEEFAILNSVLELGTKQVEQIMTPLSVGLLSILPLMTSCVCN